LNYVLFIILLITGRVPSSYKEMGIKIPVLLALKIFLALLDTLL